MATPREAHPKHTQDEYIVAAVAGTGLVLAILAGMFAAFGTTDDNIFGLGLTVTAIFTIGMVLVAIGFALWMGLTKPWKQFDDLQEAYYTGHDHHDEAHHPVSRVDIAAQNLEIIEGIGPIVEKMLAEASIVTFEQLANTSVEELKTLLKSAGLPETNPSTWPRQAQYIVDGDTEGFYAYTAQLRYGAEPEH
jgi:predicted flap endonuclease-1-like 5' DNA nuclease